MANSDRPSGMRPVSHLDGSPYNGKTNMYLCADATAIYVGDPVKSGGSAGAAGKVVNGINCEGMATIAVAAAGDTLRGVVVGFLPLQTNLETLYRVASQDRIALVADAPDLIFEVQEDGEGAPIAAIDIGENADITYAAGNTTTGRSAVELDSSDHKTATAQLRMLGLVQRPDNAIGQWAKMLVIINEHEFKSTSGL